MFDRTQYAIEEKTSYVPGRRETYEVKDVSGNLLGYAKKQRLRDNLWYEGTDGTRMGEIRYAGAHRYEVYDAQDQLLGTMTEVVRASEKRRWRQVLGMFLSSLLMMLLGLLGAYIGVGVLAVIGILGGMVLGFFTAIYCVVLVGRGEIGRREWQIEDSEDRKLLCKQLQIFTPDGDVLAEICMHELMHSRLVARTSWSIDISRRGFEPILIVSYAVLVAHRSKPID